MLIKGGKMRKSHLFVLVLVLSLNLVFFKTTNSQGLAGRLDICSPNQNPNIEWSKCNKSKSKQWVEFDENENIVYWEWKNKSNDWCGWGLRLPQSNLQPYHNDYSVKIVFNSESIFDKNNPPSIKFVDISDNSSAIVQLGENYLATINTTTENTIYTIPLKDFYRNDSKLTNLKYMQFEANWNSSVGKIKIAEIAIENTSSP